VRFPGAGLCLHQPGVPEIYAFAVDAAAGIQLERQRITLPLLVPFFLFSH
jgi:hypothetical protein